MSDQPTTKTPERTPLGEDLFVRRASNSDSSSVKELVFSVLAEYGLRPDPAGVDSDLDDIEGSYIAPGGHFELIEDRDGNLLGTVGLFSFGEGVVELRKMYFLPSLRGRGIGKLTLNRMIDLARELGFRRMTLETASVLKEAIGLYQSFGFRDMPDSHSDRCDRAFFLDL